MKQDKLRLKKMFYVKVFRSLKFLMLMIVMMMVMIRCYYSVRSVLVSVLYSIRKCALPKPFRFDLITTPTTISTCVIPFRDYLPDTTQLYRREISGIIFSMLKKFEPR